jgi:hypothetical protein
MTEAIRALSIPVLVGPRRLKANRSSRQFLMTAPGRSRPGRPAASPGMVRYATESGSELSYGDATGMTLMTETVAPVAKPLPRPRSRKHATASASALALHLDCSRAYIGKLEAEGVIQRQGDGFPLDQSGRSASKVDQRGEPLP